MELPLYVLPVSTTVSKANRLTGGGIGLSDNPNRTYWPITGGAVAFQPGWFTGHKTALLYINLGIGNQPVNYSLIMQPMFQIIGPTNDAYPGLEVCMPQVPLPANLTVKEGDNATIQVVENAKHGAALFGVRLVSVILCIYDELTGATVRRHHLHGRHEQGPEGQPRQLPQ